MMNGNQYFWQIFYCEDLPFGGKAALKLTRFANMMFLLCFILCFFIFPLSMPWDIPYVAKCAIVFLCFFEGGKIWKQTRYNDMYMEQSESRQSVPTCKGKAEEHEGASKVTPEPKNILFDDSPFADESLANINQKSFEGKVDEYQGAAKAKVKPGPKNIQFGDSPCADESFEKDFLESMANINQKSLKPKSWKALVLLLLCMSKQKKHSIIKANAYANTITYWLINNVCSNDVKPSCKYIETLSCSREDITMWINLLEPLFKKYNIEFSELDIDRLTD